MADHHQPFPKSKKQRVVRIPEEFVAFYEYAFSAYPGPWLFPHADGTMRDATWQPEDILRCALKRAGIVHELHARLPAHDLPLLSDN